MEYQNGGFIGKLGDRVNQRDGKKVVTHRYFIPDNPRTPEQQKNRASFSKAQQFVDIVDQYYPNPELFRDKSKTICNVKLGQTKKAISAGDDGKLLLPFTPHKSAFIIHTLEVKIEGNERKVSHFEIKLSKPLKDTQIYVYVWNFDDKEGTYIEMLTQRYDGDYQTFSIYHDDPTHKVGDRIFLTAYWEYPKENFRIANCIYPVDRFVEPE
jgi:hypothetical protein